MLLYTLLFLMVNLILPVSILVVGRSSSLCRRRPRPLMISHNGSSVPASRRPPVGVRSLLDCSIAIVPRIITNRDRDSTIINGATDDSRAVHYQYAESSDVDMVP
jgi:hypothetical protein